MSDPGGTGAGSKRALADNLVAQLAEQEGLRIPRPSGFRKRNRSAYANFLRSKYEAYTGQITVSSRPYYLIVDPCDACLLRCTTCPTGIENENRREKNGEPRFRTRRSTMPVDLLDALLDELGDYLFLILFFNFGEPLHNKNLPLFIRKSTSFTIETEVHSHLSLALTDAYIDDLLTAGLTTLNASIDGFSQETYQIHRVGGDCSLVKNNLERFVRARDRLGTTTNIGFNMLVFRFNEHEIPAAEQYCRDLGITFNARDAFIDDPSWLPSYRAQEPPWTVPEEVRLKSDLTVGWSPPLPLPDSSRWPRSCAWHYGYSVVQPGGQLAPCDASSKEEHDMGRIRPGEVRFGDVWNGDSYRKARAELAGADSERLNRASPLCTRCPWPQLMRQLFSLNDAKVISGFRESFRGDDPHLRRAFDLFCQIRYGLPVRDFAESADIPLHRLFVGNEGPAETAPFVEFMRTL